MSTEPNLQPKRKRRWLRWVIGILALILGPTLITWGHLEWEIHKEIQKIRAKGEPTTIAEFYAKYPIPNDPAREKLWTDALAKLADVESKLNPKRYETLPFVGPAWTEDMPDAWPTPGQPWSKDAAARELLDAHAETFRLAKLAIDGDGIVRWSVPYRQFNHLRQMAKLAALRTVVAIHGQDWEIAEEGIRLQYGTADSLIENQALLAILIREALLRLVNDVALRRVVQQIPVEETTRLIRDFLSHREFKTSDIPLIEYDRAEILNTSVDMGFNRYEPWFGLIPLPDAFSTRINLPDYLRSTAEFLVTREPSQVNQLRSVHSLRDKWEENRGFESQLARHRMGIYANLVQNQLKRMAEEHLIVCSICVREFNGRNGGFPKELVEQSSNRFEIDPFDGQRLRYRVDPDGTAVIWSVGINQTDDGGITDYLRDLDDISVRLTMPPGRPE